MEQTKLASLNEVLVGSTLSIATALVFNVTLLPLLLGTAVSFITGLKITALYQVSSVIIRFGVRRYNNAKVRREMYKRALLRSGGSLQSLQGRVSMPVMRVTNHNLDAIIKSGDDSGTVGPNESKTRGPKQTDKELRS